MYDFEWARLKYFTKDEVIATEGNPNFLSSEVMFKMDRLREMLGRAIIMTSTTGGVHAENSEHFNGRAVDFIVPSINRSSLNLVDVAFMAYQVGFARVGVYADWSYNGTTTGGLHVDIHPYKKNGWTSTFSEKLDRRVYHYPLNVENLKKIGVI